jgi:nucleoside-diphosphate-sugar epimerase
LKNKILIFGSTGFIGSELIHKLNKLDKFEIITPQIIDGIEQDILTIKSASQFYNSNIKYIINLKFYLSGTINSKNNQLIQSIVNINNNNNCSLIIHFSSMNIYSQSITENIINEETLIETRDNYSNSKKLQEDSFLKFKLNNLIILRLSNIISTKKKNKQNSYFGFIEDMLMTNTNIINIYNNGNQCYDFIDIDYMAYCLNMIINSNIIGIYNLGSGNFINKIDIINYLSNDKFTLVNLNKTTPNSYILDLTKIKNQIQLVKFDWKQSLRKIINKNKSA